MRQKVSRILLLGLMILQIIAPIGVGNAASNLQVQFDDPRIQALIDQLTPEEKVGQLFLITFNGTDISSESQIYDLVANHYIGGVILRADNDNFVAAPDTVRAAWELIREMQTVEYLSSLGELTQNDTGEIFTPTYIPLFISIEQDGGGFPNDQIISGLTELPSAMAIGATWQPDLARQVGEVLGRELSAIGFNMLLGPSLDMLANPDPESLGDLGALSFGGDPYWVGEMARAYITGVHQGSQGRIATVAKHLPGQGGVDLLPEQEIPTVRKSLAQLTQIELSPFFAVTGDAPSEDATVSAMLMSHIRYEGFQGNIRATTRPVSFDPQAFSELMSLEQFAAWRANGGVIISDDLGTRAVRRFFDPSEENFTRVLARDIAREAFLAGNDMLYLGNFGADGDGGSYFTIVATVEFFAQKYRDDLAFAQRVDESLQRILAMKFSLYEEFEIETILSSELGLEGIQQSEQISFEVSRQAATLLNPNEVDLDNALPSVPDVRTRVIFFTDSDSTAQCSQCPPQEVIPVDALAQAVNRLYGPLAGGQVFPERLLSYSVSDLSQLLADDSESSPILPLLEGSQWIVFVMQDINPDRPTSLLFHQFLAERPDLIQEKNLIVFALDAPYYLNATEISKTTAYYALYSNGSEFIDVAARLLFKELTTPGASPVSISGIGYDLFAVTSPDPEQIIPLFITLGGEEIPDNNGTPEESIPLDFQLGNLIDMSTGMILDHNGHKVPNQTPVRFLITTVTDGNAAQREILAVTVDGIAQASMRIESPGTLSIQVSSGDPAAESEVIQFDIAINGGGEDGNEESTQETPLEPIPSPVSLPGGTGLENQEPRTQTALGDWALSIFTSLFVGLFAYQTGATSGKVPWGVRWGLMSLIGGITVNVYLAFDFPGTEWLIMTVGIWGVVASSLAGAVLGWGIGWVWWLSAKYKLSSDSK